MAKTYSSSDIDGHPGVVTSISYSGSDSNPDEDEEYTTISTSDITLKHSETTEEEDRSETISFGEDVSFSFEVDTTSVSGFDGVDEYYTREELEKTTEELVEKLQNIKGDDQTQRASADPNWDRHSISTDDLHSDDTECPECGTDFNTTRWRSVNGFDSPGGPKEYACPSNSCETLFVFEGYHD